jgi:hypothetical protein
MDYTLAPSPCQVSMLKSTINRVKMIMRYLNYHQRPLSLNIFDIAFHEPIPLFVFKL